jgi:hypothetical protein
MNELPHLAYEQSASKKIVKEPRPGCISFDASQFESIDKGNTIFYMGLPNAPQEEPFAQMIFSNGCPTEI